MVGIFPKFSFTYVFDYTVILCSGLFCKNFVNIFQVNSLEVF